MWGKNSIGESPRTYNRVGWEDLSTAERKAWFPAARVAKSGNLVAVSFKLVRLVTVVELSQESLAKTLNDGVGSEEAGVTAEKMARRTGAKNWTKMIMNRPAEMNAK